MGVECGNDWGVGVRVWCYPHEQGISGFIESAQGNCEFAIPLTADSENEIFSFWKQLPAEALSQWVWVHGPLGLTRLRVYSAYLQAKQWVLGFESFAIHRLAFSSLRYWHKEICVVADAPGGEYYCWQPCMGMELVVWSKEKLAAHTAPYWMNLSAHWWPPAEAKLFEPVFDLAMLMQHTQEYGMGIFIHGQAALLPCYGHGGNYRKWQACHSRESGNLF